VRFSCVKGVAKNLTRKKKLRFFKKIIKREGGSIKVICKAGMGHHPHGLEDPAPLIDFILDATYARGD